MQDKVLESGNVSSRPSSARYRDLCLDADSPVVMEGKGCNVIPPPPRKPLWLGFLEKFKDPLIVVLLIVFLFSTAVSVYEILVGGAGWPTLLEPAGVLMALLLATGVGFLFEVRAEREFCVLNKKKDERPVKVLRWPSASSHGKGRPQMCLLAKCDVVKGDVVRLESGDEVPADGSLLSADALLVDESAFTGELYAAKSTSPHDTDTTYPGDFLLRGSIVLEGQCFYRVTAVGMETEEGRGARLIREEAVVRTPLNRQLDQLGKWITWASYVVAALIVAGRMAYYFFFDGDAANDTDALAILTFVLNSIMIAVTLIVVAVPEGLPMSVTISLAMSMRRMLKENNLVRRLHACETMGAATVICTDKTGTLTENRLRVMDDSVELLGETDAIARCVAVNSTADLSLQSDGTLRCVGNPTEGALLLWLKNVRGIDYRECRDAMTVVRQEAFTSESKRMTTYANDDSTSRGYRLVKGAPEIVLGMCDAIEGAVSRDAVAARLADVQRQGCRTLAFAIQEYDMPLSPEALSNPERLTPATPLRFLGFVGMTDPVRADVPDAVRVCRAAGVNVIMVTGDVALTAVSVARQTGIIESALQTDDGQALGLPTVITGPDFENTPDDILKRDILPSLKVLSRARPADKARLVGLLQEMGQVVAVTGDGTNDAPALKKAQVGLSMGDGTSRAKEASDITIIDNSFASINTAILWGRSLYLNIRRFILFQMTINVCACLVVLFGAFMGLDSPLNVTQMLWVNLIMDTFAAMALSSLPPDRRVMSDKPRRPGEHIVDGGMTTFVVGVGLLCFLFLFGLWQLLWHTDINAVSDLFDASLWQLYFAHFFDFTRIKAHLSRYELAIFFTFFVMMQFWNLFNARYFRTQRSLLRDVVGKLRSSSQGKDVRGPGFSITFLAIALIIIVGQVVIVNVFSEMFGVAPLSAADWLWLTVMTSPVLLIGEVWRMRA